MLNPRRLSAVCLCLALSACQTPVKEAIAPAPSSPCPPAPVATLQVPSYVEPPGKATFSLAPENPCPNQLMTLKGQGLPPWAPATVWLVAGAQAPAPSPEPLAPPGPERALSLGTANIDARGTLTFVTRLDDPFGGMGGTSQAFEIWLTLAPDAAGKAVVYRNALHWECRNPQPYDVTTPLQFPVTRGAASQAYELATQKLQALGFDKWRLYRIRGAGGGEPQLSLLYPDPTRLAATGLATRADHVWSVYLYTPRDATSRIVSIADGRVSGIETATNETGAYRNGMEIDLSRWRIDSHEAVQIGGLGANARELALERPSFPSYAPYWGISQKGPNPLINAESGELR